MKNAFRIAGVLVVLGTATSAWAEDADPATAAPQVKPQAKPKAKTPAKPKAKPQKAKTAPYVAPEVPSTPSDNSLEGDLSWLRFRTAGVYLLQPKQSGSLFTGMLSWTPEAAFGDITIGLGLGGILLKSATAGSFFAAEYVFRAGYKLTDQWAFEAQVGAQTWFLDPHTSPVAGGNLLWLLPHARLIQHFFAGYMLFLHGNDTNHQLRAGIGIGF